MDKIIRIATVDAVSEFVVNLSSMSIYTLINIQERLDAQYAGKAQCFPVFIDFALNVEIDSTSSLFAGLDLSAAKLFYNVTTKRFMIQNYSIISEEFDLS